MYYEQITDAPGSIPNQTANSYILICEAVNDISIHQMRMNINTKSSARY